MIFEKNFMVILLTGIVAVTGSIGQASAEQPSYPPMQMGEPKAAPPVSRPDVKPQRPATQYRPQVGAYRGPAPYGRPAPYGAPPPYAGRPPYGPGGAYPPPYGAGPGPWNSGGWNRGPWGGNRGFGNWFGGNRGPYGNRGPFGDMFGGRDGIWGMHPEDWFTSNPEDGFSYMWDDMINAPSEMGEMPGGWNAPSISMPNPVDVGSEFRRETPNLIREIPDMINVD